MFFAVILYENIYVAFISHMAIKLNVISNR